MTTGDNAKPKLPKPVTVTGSSFQDPVDENELNDTSETEDTDAVLPMPAAVYADDDEDVDNVKKNDSSATLNQPPLDNILPDIIPASSDPSVKTDTHKTKTSETPEFEPERLPSIPSAPLPENTVRTQAEEVKQQDNQTQQADTVFASLPPLPMDSTSEPGQVQAGNANGYSEDFSVPKIDVAAMPVAEQIPSEVSALSGDHVTIVPDIPQPPVNDAVYTPQPSPSATNTGILNQPPQTSNGLSKVFLGLGIFLIGGGLVVGGYFALTSLQGKKSSKAPVVAYQEPQQTPRPIQSPKTDLEGTPSASPVGSPKPSPKSTVKPTSDEEITVQILNGSGKKGDSLTAKNMLDSDAYKITTGNADNFDYVGLSIEYKSDYEEQAQEVAKSLEKTYGKATLESTLKASDDYDIIVTLGTPSGTAKASPTPKASSSPKATATPNP